MSRNHRWTAAVLAIVILLALPAATMGARMPYAKWWRLPSTAKDLNLNDQEKQDLDNLFIESRRALIDLKSVVEKERLELDRLMEQSTLDEGAVMERFQKLEKARAALSAERFRFLLEVRKILGPDRYQGLKVLFMEDRAKKRHSPK